MARIVLIQEESTLNQLVQGSSRGLGTSSKGRSTIFWRKSNGHLPQSWHDAGGIGDETPEANIELAAGGGAGGDALPARQPGQGLQQRRAQLFFVVQEFGFFRQP